MLASIPSASLLGVSGYPVTVEVHVGKGLPGYRIVGQPDGPCRESRDRVRAAVMSSDLEWPNQCITVNLAPSGTRKVGAGLDLAIAVGVLVASGQVPEPLVGDLAFVGELGLDGTLRRVPGVAPMVAVLGERDVVVPVAAVAEAHVAAGCRRCAPRPRSTEVVQALLGEAPWPDDPRPLLAGRPAASARPRRRPRPARRPPGTGDRRRRRAPPADGRFTRIGQDDARPAPGRACFRRSTAPTSLAVTMVHSAAGLAMPPGGLVSTPPFRAPHHTTSTIGLDRRRIGDAPAR